jgi:hypothetical protein
LGERVIRTGDYLPLDYREISFSLASLLALAALIYLGATIIRSSPSFGASLVAGSTTNAETNSPPGERLFPSATITPSSNDGGSGRIPCAYASNSPWNARPISSDPSLWLSILGAGYLQQPRVPELGLLERVPRLFWVLGPRKASSKELARHGFASPISMLRDRP